MVKLIIQIPCYNEEATLGVTLSELPRQVPGVDEAIQDFSPLKKLLQKLGSWIVRLASHANVPDAPSGFRAISREAALQLNVFNEYTYSESIRFVKPSSGKIQKTPSQKPEFERSGLIFKKSMVLRSLFTIHLDSLYTLETIIEAGQKGMAITSVPIRTNGYLRPSRLVKSIPGYIQRSVITIIRIFMTYKPLRFFTLLGSVPFSLGMLLGLRWLVYLMLGSEKTRIPSLILSAVLISIGVQLFIFGLIADLMAVNRKLLEDIQIRLRRADIQEFKEQSDLKRNKVKS